MKHMVPKQYGSRNSTAAKILHASRTKYDIRVERVVGRYQEYKDEQEDLLDGEWDGGSLKTLGHSKTMILH